MKKSNNEFKILRRLLKALGLSEARVEELIARIQAWLLDDEAEKNGEVAYPYHLRDDFLSPAELNFYHVLQTAVSDSAVLFVKVSLGDLFFAQTGDFAKNRAYRNKIDRKHVDFLLCDPQTIRPLLGIELDDKSHQTPKRQLRDRFVDKLFAAAQLPLIHIPVRHTYSVESLRQLLSQHVKGGQAPSAKVAPSSKTSLNSACPKCGAAMRLRTAQNGRNKGKKFLGCSNFPQCRTIVHLPTQ